MSELKKSDKDQQGSLELLQKSLTSEICKEKSEPKYDSNYVSEDISEDIQEYDAKHITHDNSKNKSEINM